MTRYIPWFIITLAALIPGARAGVVINEIYYRPGSTFPENTGLEYIEVHNTDAAPIDMSGWAFTSGVSFSFPAGSIIGAGGFAVVASDPLAVQSAFGITGVFGPWAAGATLSNNDENVRLSKPSLPVGTMEDVDEVHYASEGDWATRVRETTFNGWEWSTPANGGGKSMELRNPLLSNDNGQNWAPSTAAGNGTPGAPNSTLTGNVPPIIHDVSHRPAVPKSTDPVTITCEVNDELLPQNRNATLHWREATNATPGSFQTVTMVNDGAGKFSATLDPLQNLKIVEFYISSNDGTATRTWPAATSEGQNANCQYQVNDEVMNGTDPYYFLVLTGAENAAYAAIEGPDGSGNKLDRQFNQTFVAVRGTETTIRYRASIRFRGNSSRDYQFKPLRVSLANDNDWDGITDWALNPRSTFVQLVSFRLLNAAGVRATDAMAVELRRNGVEQTTSSNATPDFGKWVHVEEINGAMTDAHWPNAKGGNIYKKGRPDEFWRSTQSPPNNPNGTLDGWSKQNNSAANDWSDLTNFFEVWQAAAAPHFDDANPGDVFSGDWDGTVLNAAELASVAEVSDLNQWARWFAAMTIIQDVETNISTGDDDDYLMYLAPTPGGLPKVNLVSHDLDTALGQGESQPGPTSRGLYDMTFNGSVFETLLPLIGDDDRPGNATFRTMYHNVIRELYGSTIFDADTQGGARPNPPYYQFLDSHLGGWVPDTRITAMKNFATARQAHLLGLIGQGAITPPAPTSNASFPGAHGQVFISEILARNVTAHAVAGTFPDYIEISNAGPEPVNIGGMTLTDDPAMPAKYPIPANTILQDGGYIIIYADSNTAAPGLHSGFGLDQDGDEIRLLYASSADGGAMLDAVTFGPQAADVSISRTGPALDQWNLTPPTPGAIHSAPITTSAIAPVRINEIYTNPNYLFAEDFIELYNPSAQPVALGGAAITDDAINHPTRHVFPPLSFIGAGDYLVLRLLGNDASAGNPTDLPFKLSAFSSIATLKGANGTIIDQFDVQSLPPGVSRGRSPDGSTSLAFFGLPTTIPSPGTSNVPPPAPILALLNQLRVTELLYKPNNLEFIELQNIGATPLDVSGVRFTGGVGYTFAAGTTLAPGAFIVICKDRTAFLSQYGDTVPLAAGVFTGVLDNSGETLTLQTPAPYDVNILRFRYEASWYPETDSNRSLITVDAPITPPSRWDEKETWSASPLDFGSPGRAEPPMIKSSLTVAAIIGDPFYYQIAATQLPTNFSATGLPTGLLLGPTGAITGTPTQTGQFNVLIGASNAVGSDSETLVITIAPFGPLVGFGFDNIGNQVVTEPFTGTLRARDAGGRTVTTFNGTADISAKAAVGTPVVVFTEFGNSSPTPDYFELQNVGSATANTAGWIVFTNRANNVNSVHTVTWPLPATVAPGQIIGACDNTATPAPTETVYAGDIDWPGDSTHGWIMLVDNNGTIRDFVAWGYTAAEIASIDFTRNGTNYTVGSQWAGNGTPVAPANQSGFRNGSADTNNAANWSIGPSPNPRGTQNTGLTVPWNPGFLPLTSTGLGTVNVTNGAWTGTVTITQTSPTAELHAVISGQPLTRSNSFAVAGSGANKPPTFTKGSDQVANEDSGTHTVTSWATNISPGGVGEGAQVVSFLVSNDNNTLFSTQPAISNNGTLTFAPSLNFHGSATVTVRARDNGGTADGGVDTSQPQTFTITVQPVNDPPVVIGGANIGVGQMSGPQTIAWTTFTPGPTNESAQTIGVSVENDNHSLFTVQPTIATNGTLTFTPSVDGSGVANVTVTVTDNGGTSNGGIDTTVRTFTITVTGINDAPFFTAGADVVAPVSLAYSKGWATAIAPGPPDESAQNVAFYVLTNSNPSIFVVQPRIKPDGTLEFTPGKNPGTAMLTVHLRDSGGVENGGNDASTTASFNIRLVSVAASAGKFRGLVAPTGAPTVQTSGLGEFTLSAKGSFTGKLKVGGKTYPVSGKFDGGGNAQFGRNGSALSLKRTNLAPLSLSMQLNLDGAAPTISGQILDASSPFSEFTAERDAYRNKTAPVPATLLDNAVNKGNYTSAFRAQPAPNNGMEATQFPQGDGWAAIKLAAGGTLTVRGQLADGTKFTYASGLNSANSFPYYVPLYKFGGAVVGSMAFADPGLTGSGLTWFRPPQLFPKPSPQYSQGWPTGIALGFEGASRNTVTEPNVLPAGNATLTLTGGTLPVPFEPLQFTIGFRNKVTAPLLNGKKVPIVIKPTGEWTGNFIHPVTFKKTTLQGVVLRHLGEGTGYFLGGSEGGKASITIGP